MILVRPYKSNKKHHKGETGERIHAEVREREEKEKKEEGRKRETKGRVSDNNENGQGR